MRISLVIPAFNEEHRIVPTLEKYMREFFPDRSEYIVVINASTDRTRQVVESVRQTAGDRVTIYEIPERGKGLAVRYGLERAKGELIGFLDADGSTSPSEFAKLVEAVETGHLDGAIASRWAKGSKVVGRTTPLRTLASWGFYAVTKLLFWLPYRDTQCGAKLFTRETIKAIVPELRVKDMSIDVEILRVAAQQGRKISEIPSVWIDKSSPEMLGTKFFRTSLRMLRSLFYIRIIH